jgi:hypothetical protein
MPWPASSTSCSNSSARRLGLGQLRRQPHRLRPDREHKTDGQTKIVNADYGVPLGDAGYLRFGAESRSRNPTQRAGASDAGWTSWNSTPADLARRQGGLQIGRLAIAQQLRLLQRCCR